MTPYFEELERRLVSAHANAPAGRRKARRSGAWPIAAVAAALLIGAMIVVPAVGGLMDEPEIEATTRPSAGSPISAAMLQDFPIFARPRGPQDSLAGRIAGAPPIDADQTRAIPPQPPLSGPGRAVSNRFFVAPSQTNEGVCVLALPVDAAGPASACATRQQALAGDSYITIEHDGGWEIAGIVGPGARTVSLENGRGETTSTAARHGVFSAWIPERAVDITVHGD